MRPHSCSKKTSRRGSATLRFVVVVVEFDVDVVVMVAVVVDVVVRVAVLVDDDDASRWP